ncbi:MAG: NTP transferase domain-containing protein [Chloroflexi bacterium]|nr:NTP transferase domain-containing protein [Chloroflexota bacterium]
MIHAVILAAGNGGRLQPLTAETPKPLIEVRGRPLIGHVLDSLLAAGVRDVVIVIGYRGGQVRAALEATAPAAMKLAFVENPDYRAGNARSLWAARHAVDGPFLLAMADHLVEPALISDVIANANGRCALAIEHARGADPRATEATLARVEAGRVRDLGKRIENWNALDTGVFLCTNEVFNAITPDLRHGEASTVFASLARVARLDAVDVTGRRWLDVDTPEDLAAAEAWLAIAAANAA